MRCMFQKMPGGYLMPVGEEAEELVAGIKVGSGLWVDATKARNPRFHAKVLKLIRIAFDAWDPEQALSPVRIDGIVPGKDFEKFREKILILAGHCDEVYGLDGTVEFKVRSISFANCGEQEFQRVYRNILNVVWERIMQQANYRTPQELENVVNTLLTFN